MAQGVWAEELETRRQTTTKATPVSPDATGMLQPAAFSAFTASHTRAGYTHTAATVMPTRKKSKQPSVRQVQVAQYAPN